MHTELLRRFYRPPNAVTLMLTDHFAVLLKIWVYRHDFSPINSITDGNITLLLPSGEQPDLA
jgi:hypothetical protein